MLWGHRGLLFELGVEAISSWYRLYLGEDAATGETIVAMLVAVDMSCSTGSAPPPRNGATGSCVMSFTTGIRFHDCSNDG